MAAPACFRRHQLAAAASEVSLDGFPRDLRHSGSSARRFMAQARVELVR